VVAAPRHRCQGRVVVSPGEFYGGVGGVLPVAASYSLDERIELAAARFGASAPSSPGFVHRPVK